MRRARKSSCRMSNAARQVSTASARRWRFRPATVNPRIRQDGARLSTGRRAHDCSGWTRFGDVPIAEITTNRYVLSLKRRALQATRRTIRAKLEVIRHMLHPQRKYSAIRSPSSHPCWPIARRSSPLPPGDGQAPGRTPLDLGYEQRLAAFQELPAQLASMALCAPSTPFGCRMINGAQVAGIERSPRCAERCGSVFVPPTTSGERSSPSRGAPTTSAQSIVDAQPAASHLAACLTRTFARRQGCGAGGPPPSISPLGARRGHEPQPGVPAGHRHAVPGRWVRADLHFHDLRHTVGTTARGRRAERDARADIRAPHGNMTTHYSQGELTELLTPCR